MLLLSVSAFLSLFYIFSSGVILLVYLVPHLNSRLLKYGARESRKIEPSTVDGRNEGLQKDTNYKATKVLDFLAGIRVPHTWFLHFYIVSVASSLIWFHQICSHGTLLQFFAVHSPPTEDSATAMQLALCWTMMLIQGTRRLYECLTLFQPSSSTMWIGHYAVGLAFYIATGIAIWIRGLDTIRAILDITDELHFTHLPIAAYTCLPLFLTASCLQHQAHVYLAGLQKYTLPAKGAFSFLISPHYTAECAIYLSLAILGTPGPSRQVFGLHAPLIWAFMFVAINLGVSAEMTRAWMAERFGQKAVGGKVEDDTWDVVAV